MDRETRTHLKVYTCLIISFKGEDDEEKGKKIAPDIVPLGCQLEDMFQLIVTPQGIKKVTIQFCRVLGNSELGAKCGFEI